MKLTELGYTEEDIRFLPLEAIREIFKRKITKNQLEELIKERRQDESKETICTNNNRTGDATRSRHDEEFTNM